MSNFSNYLENALLNHSLGGTTYTKPSAVYLALYTTAPTDSGGGTEVSGNGYARQSVAFSSASSGNSKNSAAKTFTASGGNWGTITAIGLFDASTGGNLLYYSNLAASRTINNGESLVFAIDSISITLD